MIKTVASFELPVNETLMIRKNVLEPEQPTGMEKRLCVVTGTHGDELEGQYVCYELNRRIQEQMHHLKGIVEIYPALNPLGLDTITRSFPIYDVDMNRIFPGTPDGSMAEAAAEKVFEDLAGADLCIDVHASNIYIREIPQVRLNKSTSDDLLFRYAKRLNTEFVWVHPASTVLESTLAHSLNTIGVPTLVVEMGVGMRITEKFCFQLVDGIFCLMKDLGIWDGEVIEPKEPVVSLGGEVGFVNAETSGIFVPKVKHRNDIKKGEVIGLIDTCLAEAVEWASQRETFGKRLVQHQVARQKLVAMATRIEATRALLEDLMRRMQAGESPVAQLCMLKNFATQSLQFCADTAVQLLGGMGFMRGTKSERIYREVKVYMIGGGAEEVLSDLAARQLGWV